MIFAGAATTAMGKKSQLDKITITVDGATKSSSKQGSSNTSAGTGVFSRLGKPKS